MSIEDEVYCGGRIARFLLFRWDAYSSPLSPHMQEGKTDRMTGTRSCNMTLGMGPFLKSDPDWHTPITSMMCVLPVESGTRSVVIGSERSHGRNFSDSRDVVCLSFLLASWLGTNFKGAPG
jgi:hypothetical protein